MWLVEWTMDLLMIVFSGILYDLAGSVLMIVDFVQEMFRKLAGMGELWIGKDVTNNVDPAIAIMSSEVVLQVLLALSIVAVAMVIIATIIQIIRTEFSTEGSKNTKGQIFGKALRALMMFFVVPLVCMGGVILSNAMLRVIDTATAGPVQTTMGAQLAVSSLESCFKENTSDSQKQEIRNKLLTKSEDYTRSKVVKQYYELKDCNFVVLIGGSLMALWILVNASFGLVMRMYYLAIYFIISPTMVGLMPLTEAPFGKWRSKFIGQVLGAYGTVVTLNLMFQLMPVVNNINLFEPGSYANEIAHILFTLTALFMMKDLPKKLADLIGAEDASEGGAGMAKQVGGAAMKIGMAATGGVAGLAMKGMGAAAGGLAKVTGGKTSKVFGAIGNSVGGIGNKLSQNAKGITGGALNKVVGAATFGAVKGPFSEERNVEKAQEAKAKKVEAKQKALKDGTAGVGAILGDKIATSRVGGAVGGVLNSISTGGQSTMQNIAAKAAVMDVSGKVEKVTGAIGTLDSASPIKVNAAGAQVTDAKGNTVLNTAGPDPTKGDPGSIRDQFDSVMKSLTVDHDGAAAGDQLSSMIDALNNIAEKSEEQKDLLSKLTVMREQVQNSSGTKAALDRIGTSSVVTQIQTKADTVSQDAARMAAIQTTSTFNISAIATKTGTSQESELKRQIEGISKDLTTKGIKLDEGEIRKLVQQMAQQYKSTLEAKTKK